MASLLTDNNVNTVNPLINTFNDNLSNNYNNLTQQAKKQALERIIAITKFEMIKVDKNVHNELPHFEDLEAIFDICSGTNTNPGIISYIDDDILAMVNMFAKTSTKFLKHKPLYRKYFTIVLAKKYGGAPLLLTNGGKRGILTLSDTKILVNELKYNLSLPNNDGRNVLHEASVGGYLSIVRFLIEEFDMDVHELDGDNGKSVTYLSALHGKIDVVNYLLEKGGDWNDKNEGLVNRLEDHYDVNFSSDAIDLEDKNITDEDVQIIGELLKTNNTIKKLDLHDNNITHVQSIGEGLKTNNTLEILYLQNNNITDDSGIQSIIDGLKTNNTLRRLEIYNNQLSDNMRSQLNAIKQYKRDGSNGYQHVEGMEIKTELEW